MKVLVVCVHGVNRSRYLADFLKEKGYDSDCGGIGMFVPNPLRQEQVDNADVIIVVKEDIKEEFVKKFNIKGKKIITLDVSDEDEYNYPLLKEKVEGLLPLK